MWHKWSGERKETIGQCEKQECERCERSQYSVASVVESAEVWVDVGALAVEVDSGVATGGVDEKDMMGVNKSSDSSAQHSICPRRAVQRRRWRSTTSQRSVSAQPFHHDQPFDVHVPGLCGSHCTRNIRTRGRGIQLLWNQCTIKPTRLTHVGVTWHH